MRRALLRAITFHSTVEEPPPCVPAIITPPPEPELSEEPESTTDGSRRKRRERAQTRASNCPPTPPPEVPKSITSTDVNSPLSVAMSKANLSRTQINLPDIMSKISASWGKPIDQTPVAGDLPRLASRIIIQDVRAGKNEEYCIADSASPKDFVSNFMNRVCTIVEDDPTVPERLRTHVQQSKDSPAELRHWAQELLSIAGGDSKTVAVCKMVSQSIIMPVATQIKVIIFGLTNGFTKDVRTTDGWRIILRFSDDGITCTHIKKEISMATGANSFEFEWHLSIWFSLRLDKIDKVQLSLLGLICNEAMSKEQKQKLTEAMVQMVSED